MVCNKQFITLSHCEIGVISLMKILLVKSLIIFHADPCNKCYIFGETNQLLRIQLLRLQGDNTVDTNRNEE